jgi:hypothetical protein
MLLQQGHLAVHDLGPERQVDVGLPQVAVPLRDLVFQDQVISERGPGQAAQLAVVLVGVVAAMGQDQVGLDALAQGLEPELDLPALLGEEPVLERGDVHGGGGCSGKERGRRRPGLGRTHARRAQHAPVRV